MIHLMDDHNKALYYWYEALAAGLITPGLQLVHIDQHSDMREPSGWIDASRQCDLLYIQEYIDEYTNVGNFILPAQRAGLIGEILQVRTEYSLLHLDSGLLEDRYILDIDVDFWEPAMSIQEDKKTKQIVRKLMESAALVTIATSPGFIDQNLAQQIVEELLYVS